MQVRREIGVDFLGSALMARSPPSWRRIARSLKSYVAFSSGFVREGSPAEEFADRLRQIEAGSAPAGPFHGDVVLGSPVEAGVGAGCHGLHAGVDEAGDLQAAQGAVFVAFEGVHRFARF